MLILSTIYLLISNALQSRRDMSILFSRSTMYFCIFVSLLIYITSSSKLLENGIALYSGLFFLKPTVVYFSFFIFLLTSLILGLTSFYPRKITQDLTSANEASLYNSKKNIDKENNINEEEKAKIHILINKNLTQYKILEYSLLILFAINGAMFLMSSNDLISIFLSIELQSYALYLLCAVYRDSEISSKAALTYFLLGGLSSCIILLGQSLIYINSGNTNLDGIYVINNISDTINYTKNITSLTLSDTNIYQYYMQSSLLVFSVGFLFKISSAPFHNWSPDVYDQIPTIVTTFVAIIAKISILIMFSELVYYTTVSNSFNLSWKNNLLLSALLSLVIGSLMGLTQSRIKRLYAYSTISHLGFILLSLSIISVESSMAFFFYIVQYSITNLNAFFILIAIGYSLYIYNLSDTKNETNSKNKMKDLDDINKVEENRNYSPIQYINELSNYYKINTYLALSLGLTLFSFLGVPPLIGFFGKQMVLSAALDKGYVFMVLIAILTSVISAVYYLVIIKVIFFEKNDKYIANNIIQNKEHFSKASNLQPSENFKQSKHIEYNLEKIKLNSFLSNTISFINLWILLFIFYSKSKISLFLLLSFSFVCPM